MNSSKMINSKLIALLRTFDAKTLNRFSEFLKSPYFNKKTDLEKLFKNLKKTLKAEDRAENLDRKVVFRSLFPEKEYTEKGFNHLISELFSKAEEFLRHENIKGGTFLPVEFDLLEYYMDHQLDKHYQYHYSKLAQKVNQESSNQIFLHFYKSTLAEIADQQFLKKKERKYDKNLQAASDALDVFYMAKKLKYLCGMLDRNQEISERYVPRFKEEARFIFKTNRELVKIPYLRLYYALFLAIENDKEPDYFRQFKEEIFSSSKTSIDQEELKNLYFFGINYCLRKFRQGNKSFAKDLMEFYQSGIEEGVLLENGRISPWTFKNMVKLGLGLNRFDWTKHFIEHYSGLLPGKMREDALNFNLAELHYYQKDYEKALQFLNQVKFSDLYYSLNVKEMLIKIYFEQGETQVLDSLLQSFETFLRRKTNIPKNTRMPYMNFIKMVSLLRKYKAIGKSNMVRREVEKTKVLAAKTWLLKQVA